MKKINKVVLLLLVGVTAVLLFGCGKEKYSVDYDGAKDSFKGAKDRYEVGSNVTLYYNMIATDTNYTFYLDEEELIVSYDEKKGIKIEFTMPDHDVKLRIEKFNSMISVPNFSKGISMEPIFSMTTGNAYYMVATAYENSILTLKIINDTEEAQGYGEDYSLEILCGDEYVKIDPITDLCFIEIFNIIEPHSESEITCDLSVFGRLVTGTYRLVKGNDLAAEFKLDVPIIPE